MYLKSFEAIQGVDFVSTTMGTWSRGGWGAPEKEVLPAFPWNLWKKWFVHCWPQYQNGVVTRCHLFIPSFLLLCYTFDNSTRPEWKVVRNMQTHKLYALNWWKRCSIKPSNHIKLFNGKEVWWSIILICFILGSLAPVEPGDVEKLDFYMYFGTTDSPVILISIFVHRNNTTQSQHIQHMLCGLATICAQRRLRLTEP